MERSLLNLLVRQQFSDYSILYFANYEVVLDENGNYSHFFGIIRNGLNGDVLRLIVF